MSKSFLHEVDAVKLVLASNNKKKLAEMREILSSAGFEVLSQAEAGCDFEAEENGTTFAENAYIKAKAAMDACSMPAIADDSGLCVEALGGEPGVYSARYSGSHDHSDAQRNEYLLSKLEGVSDRRAKFVCSIACCFPDGRVIRAEGECHGEIGFEPKGENGFGYDPLFIMADYPGRTMAEISAEEKNAVSHRGRALNKFKEELLK
ncbi:MAG: XTP/dITP diphosphatase [Oscillospiraceae bacterium]|nr:XTP/dITP diphosphatase [Oscillospiraceae bacterium]